MVFLAVILAKGVIWLGRPCMLWFQHCTKGARVLGVSPCLAPDMLLCGAATMTSGSPQSIGVTNPPNAKGFGAVLPNAEL